MLKPKLRVHGAERQIRAVAVGDTVFIIRSLPGVPLDSISPFPAPMIVSIDESGTGKRGQTFRFKVQFQTRERTTHVGYFFSRHLRATKKVLGIGTKVVVKAQIPGVMVPVGTEGTVVGGDGKTYHITFFLDSFEPPITVSHDGVPADAVGLAGEKRGVAAVEDAEEESENESNDVDGEERGGEGAEAEPGEEPKEEEVMEEGGVQEEPGEPGEPGEQEDAPVAPPARVQAVLAKPLRDALAAHLQPAQVDLLCAYVVTLGVEEVTDALTLQGYLAQYLRHARDDGDVVAQLPAEHMIALKEAGASDEELTRYARDGVTAKLTVAAAVKRYERGRP